MYTSIHEESTGLAHQHGGYVQDVLYADYAGAIIGDADIAKKAHFSGYPGFICVFPVVHIQGRLVLYKAGAADLFSMSNPTSFRSTGLSSRLSVPSQKLP